MTDRDKFFIRSGFIGIGIGTFLMGFFIGKGLDTATAFLAALVYAVVWPMLPLVFERIFGRGQWS
jgi:hypothetical protein